MVPYLGDFAEDATIYIPFNTFSSDDPAASVTITDLADADIKVHKDASTTEIATDGATISIDFDSVTGNHLATIDTSVHADYSTGSDYLVRIEGTTVDGATINAWIGQFSIENRYSAGALRPTTAGRTLDVDASGHASADVVSISGSTTAADNLEASALGIVSTAVNDASATTTSFVTDLTETTDDHYNGRIIVFTSGNLDGQSTYITDYTGSSKTVTVEALTEAPADNDTFVIV